MRLLLFILLALSVGLPAQAQKGRMMGGQGGQRMQGTEEEVSQMLARRGLFPTGLSPVFPLGLSCPEISSAFGSPTRYDNSSRNNEFGGKHNGMDITLDEGTPLLAVADGEVVHAGTGGQLVGNFVWLRLAPKATGLPLYVFARYQHLERTSPLKPGDLVGQGDVVGISGNTGTTGGHYGSAGYHHLHLNLLASPSPEFEIDGNTPKPRNFVFLDPMGLYAPAGLSRIDNTVLNELPQTEKRRPVSVMTSGKMRVENGSGPIWPVACETR